MAAWLMREGGVIKHGEMALDGKRAGVISTLASKRRQARNKRRDVSSAYRRQQA